ncbi:anti-sigma-D factor RsdA [Amycolatopsis solani]|uniref:anti-sigma-D factor RsdA n=1 Tax=Amycolatopsis solani TaxID=3028615 RepID=UPI0025AF6CC3|nr:anti-sigma-D factor RsdA [Amycolatopsis sp. MEP2-6]
MGIVRKLIGASRWIENVAAVEAPRLAPEVVAEFEAELSAVAASDAYLTALGGSGAVAGADPLDAALLGWRREVDSVPMPSAWRNDAR